MSEVAIAGLEVFAACFADRFLVGDAHPIVKNAMSGGLARCACIRDVVRSSVGDFNDRLLKDFLV